MSWFPKTTSNIVEVTHTLIPHIKQAIFHTNMHTLITKSVEQY